MFEAVRSGEGHRPRFLCAIGKAMIATVAAVVIAGTASTALAAAEAVVSPEAIIIKGIAQWQAKAVRNRALNTFGYRITEDAYVSQFFPDTAAAVSGHVKVDGKQLIPTVRYYFNKDLDVLLDAIGCFAYLGKHTRQEAVESIALLTEFKNPEMTPFRFYSEAPICRKVTTANDQNQDILSLARQDLNAAGQNDSYRAVLTRAIQLAVTVVFEQKKEGKQATRDKCLADKKIGCAEEIPDCAGDGKKTADCIQQSRQEAELARALVALILLVQDMMPPLAEQANAVPTPPNRSAVIDHALSLLDQLKSQEQSAETTERVAQFSALLSPAVDKSQRSSTESTQNSGGSKPKSNKEILDAYTIYVHQFLNLLDILEVPQGQWGDFDRFKSTAFFLAGLVDASKQLSPDGVQAAIELYVDREAAWQSKLRPSTNVLWSSVPNSTCTWLLFCHDSIFIGSYYGFAAMGLDEDGAGGRELKFRAYGPIGLDWKLVTVFDGPLSIGFAPFDIGNYVTAELKGKDYDAKFSSVTASSAYLAFTFPRLSLAVLVGYHWDAEVADGRTTDSAFASVAFDLPVFKLH